MIERPATVHFRKLVHQDHTFSENTIIDAPLRGTHCLGRIRGSKVELSIFLTHLSTVSLRHGFLISRPRFLNPLVREIDDLLNSESQMKDKLDLSKQTRSSERQYVLQWAHCLG